MKLLGWLAFGAGIFLVDSAIANRAPLTTLKLVLGSGTDVSHLPTPTTPIYVNPQN